MFKCSERPGGLVKYISGMLIVYCPVWVDSGRKMASVRISWTLVDPASCYAALGMDDEAESYIHSLNWKLHDSGRCLLR